MAREYRQDGWSRRSVLRATGALAAPAYLALRSRSARAAGKEVVLMTSGGPFMNTYQQKIAVPFEQKTGIKVRMLPGNNKAHSMALRGNPTSPPFDVYSGNGDDFLRLCEAGLIKKISATEVPSLPDVHPKFRDGWDGFGATFDYSSVGIAYRTDRIKAPPASWKEFIDRTAAGEFGNSVFMNSMAAGVRGPEVLVTLARALTGNPENVEVGFEALKKIKPYVFKYFTSFNDPVVLLMNDEGAIGPGWDGRTFIAHDESKGKVNWINPTEGPASSGPVVGVVKSGNTELAQMLIDYALGEEAQKAFCEAMFYGATNSKVKYSEALARRIPSIDAVTVPDERFLNKNVGAWIERWNREIAA